MEELNKFAYTKESCFLCVLISSMDRKQSGTFKLLLALLQPPVH